MGREIVLCICVFFLSSCELCFSKFHDLYHLFFEILVFTLMFLDFYFLPSSFGNLLWYPRASKIWLCALDFMQIFVVYPSLLSFPLFTFFFSCPAFFFSLLCVWLLLFLLILIFLCSSFVACILLLSAFFLLCPLYPFLSPALLLRFHLVLLFFLLVSFLSYWGRRGMPKQLSVGRVNLSTIYLWPSITACLRWRLSVAMCSAGYWTPTVFIPRVW